MPTPLLRRVGKGTGAGRGRDRRGGRRRMTDLGRTEEGGAFEYGILLSQERQGRGRAGQTRAPCVVGALIREGRSR